MTKKKFKKRNNKRKKQIMKKLKLSIIIGKYFIYNVMNFNILNNMYMLIICIIEKNITLIHDATTKSTFEINVVVNLIQNKKLLYNRYLFHIKNNSKI